MRGAGEKSSGFARRFLRCVLVTALAAGPLSHASAAPNSGPGAWDRLEASGPGGPTGLNIDTVDGFTLRAFFYPAATDPKLPADRLIVVPDVYNENLETLEPMIANLNRDFHVVLLIPRGHLPSDRDFMGRRRQVDEMARNPGESARFLNDYRALLSLLGRTRELPGHQGRTCILAGKFHATILLLDELRGVDCLILLSPNPNFFDRDLVGLVSSRIKIPVLLVNDERSAFRLKPLAEKLSAASISAFPLAGVGLRMLYRRPEILDTIRGFLKSSSRQK